MNRLSFIFCFLSFIFLSLQAQTSRFEEYILYPATGGPLVGATVVLEDLDTGTNYPLSEVIGKPGLYRSDNIPMMRYKLIINGATSSTGLFFPAYRIQQFLDIVDSDADNLVDGAYLESGSVPWVKLSEAVKDSIRAGGGGTVNITNVPDDTTLTTNASDQLKIKDLGVDNQHLAADAVTTAKVLDGTLTGNDVQNGALPYNKLDSASVYTWLNASGAFSEGAVDFLPIDASNLTGALGDFTLPSGLGGGTITITAGETATGMEFDYPVVADSLLEEGSILDSLFINFSDSVNKVINNRSQAWNFTIDSLATLSPKKYPLMRLTNPLTIDSVIVVCVAEIEDPAFLFNLHFGTNISTSGNIIFDSDKNITSGSTGNIFTDGFADNTIPGKNFIWATFTGSNVGSYTLLTIIGTED